MKTRVIAILLSMSLLSLQALAQVSVDVKVDSVEFLVGQQDGIELKVSSPAGKKILFPDLKVGQEIIPNVEIVEILKPDTQNLDEGNVVKISQRYIITAWDSSFYFLPPFVVKVDGKEYPSNQLALKVYTLDVDTVHVDQFFPPHDIMDNPFDWEDLEGVIISFICILILGLLVAFLEWRIRNGKPIFHIIRREKKLPPHQVAMSNIMKIKEERKWAEEDSKEYYTMLTDTLRTYIQERYGFSAMEMTSSEIIERLTAEKDAEAIGELHEIFQTADLVKFAKWSTLINENDANLLHAIEYVDRTKQEPDPNAAPEPEIIKETDEKRQREVRISRFFTLLSALIILCSLAYIVYRLWDLFS